MWFVSGLKIGMRAVASMALLMESRQAGDAEWDVLSNGVKRHVVHEEIPLMEDTNPMQSGSELMQYWLYSEPKLTIW
jgi:hypothetical protein